MQADRPIIENTIREMAHELRTPLTSIMGFAELLLEDETIVGSSREYLTVINDESRKLATILNDYLEVLLPESDYVRETEGAGADKN